jgi:hypothetical protein
MRSSRGKRHCASSRAPLCAESIPQSLGPRLESGQRPLRKTCTVPNSMFFDLYTPATYGPRTCHSASGSPDFKHSRRFNHMLRKGLVFIQTKFERQKYHEPQSREGHTCGDLQSFGDLRTTDSFALPKAVQTSRSRVSDL